MPRPITFPPLTAYSDNHVSRLPIDALVRLAVEHLFKPFWCACGDMHRQGVLCLNDFLPRTRRALSRYPPALARAVGAPAYSATHIARVHKRRTPFGRW